MLIIGHRGAKGLAPENTIASFQAALDAGVDGIEFDVRTTKDNVPVIFHDAKISQLPISRSDLKSLKSVHPDLLTLDELLRFLKNRIPIIIEIKPGTATAPIIECIEAHLHTGWKVSNISISSFDFKILQDIRAGLPSVTIVVNEAWSGVRAARSARKLGTTFITMNQKWLWGGFIKSVVRSGYKLTAYTVNNPAKAKKWKKLGLYAIVTDSPDKF